MIRNDIEQVFYQIKGFERPAVAKLGGKLGMNFKEITLIDFSEETKICRFHHEDGSMTILANSEFLMLHTKNIMEG
ncbi:hypothetical protein M2139_000308 [Enterococcus sp. PF1-24]|uniref:hypothetical protein n=1 Tax=unclassified Enterococcus TaxID=2608891 RepID=UPI002473E7E6|nr:MULTISPECIES: hypothetical protein [unclassified Enterococcus]MDH6363272.1 hypothetical protein [Enterococcus sp. PFB1-1]MDH6400427.1 hypothetical protein [Enterococcus sp. PF1-24]